jgi:murein DD-endopeptidase MepM/ murein hydrolase activator NlpD
MRRLALAVVVLLALASPAFGDDVAKKQQLDSKISSLQGKLAASQQQESALRGQVSDYTSRIRTLEGKVGDVSLRLHTLEADLALHQRRLNALNALFALQTKRFVFLKQQYATSMQVLDQRLVDIYESDPASTIDVFLGARSVQDAIDQVQYLNDIGAEDRRIAQEVASAKAAIKIQRAKTKKLRKTVQGETAVISARTAQTRDVRDELVGAKNDLSATRQQKLQDISHLNAQQQAEVGEIDALQSASEAIAERIRAAQAARAAAARAAAAQQAGSQSGSQASTTDSTASSSGLIWPVSGPITSPFGWRWGRMHQGIDIGVGYGTPIHAAASGTIIYCGWESGYGNLTVIDHGGDLATAYGHQSSIAVACGQHVNQGDVIGYVGCTGHCFGPHLHFEVRINGSPVDPLGYL